jgi:hypothetical protein
VYIKREKDREKECIYKSVNDEITVVKTGSQTRDTAEWISSEAEDAGSLAPDAKGGGMADKFFGEGLVDSSSAFLVLDALRDFLVFEPLVLFPASLGLHALHDLLSDGLEGLVGFLGGLCVVAGVSLAVFVFVDEAFGQLLSFILGVLEVLSSGLGLPLSSLQDHVTHGGDSFLVHLSHALLSCSAVMDAPTSLLGKLLFAVLHAVGGMAVMVRLIALLAGVS